MRLVNFLLALFGLVAVASVYLESKALQACLILIIFLMLLAERRSRHSQENKIWRRLNGNQRIK